MAPVNRPVGFDDEHRRGGHAITEQVEHAVGHGNFRSRVGQQWVARLDRNGHLRCAFDCIDAYSHQRRVQVLELSQVFLQLAELTAANTLEKAPVKHYDRGVSALEQIGQRDRLTGSRRKRKVGGQRDVWVVWERRIDDWSRYGLAAHARVCCDRGNCCGWSSRTGATRRSAYSGYHGDQSHYQRGFEMFFHQAFFAFLAPK